MERREQSVMKGRAQMEESAKHKKEKETVQEEGKQEQSRKKGEA